MEGIHFRLVNAFSCSSIFGKPIALVVNSFLWQAPLQRLLECCYNVRPGYLLGHLIKALRFQTINHRGAVEPPQRPLCQNEGAFGWP